MTEPRPSTPPTPPAWIRRWAPLIAPAATVLDVACGGGRHLRWLAARGHAVVGVDRDAAALEPLRALGEIVCADLESAPWPFAGRTFGAVVVTNYLWRPLFPQLRASVAPGGVLLYETFALGQETLGVPRNPDFLLRPGELLQEFPRPDWQVVAYEDGLDAARPERLQRIAAIRVDPAHPRTAYALPTSTDS